MTQGFYWHVHHDLLLEWCWDYEERREYIVKNKPEKERELRLRLFRSVQGKLSEEITMVRAECKRAVAEYDGSHRKYLNVYDRLEQTWAVRNQAFADLAKVIQSHIAEIEALHAVECPDCPWDGHTIFLEEQDED